MKRAPLTVTLYLLLAAVVYALPLWAQAGLALYLLLVFKAWALSPWLGPRLLLVAIAPALALDCAGNVLVGGSFDHTLSAEAWLHADHDWWGWTHKAIDALFFWQDGHCKAQAGREYQHGSVWAAWRAGWTERVWK